MSGVGTPHWLTPEQREVVEIAADLALDIGGPVVAEGLLLLPDVVVIEGYVNGLPTLPAHVSLQRGDGRVVHIFRAPS